MPLVAHAQAGGAMKLENRDTFGWPTTAAPYAPCDQGLVVHYDGSNQGLAKKNHTACRSYWKGTRSFHMGPSRGWLDIGYSFGVCPHGIVLEGRGWQRQQAAQPGGNTTWTSVTFMSGDAEQPTAAQIGAFRQLRAWLRGKGLGAGIRGHRDFISTSCPGSILYGMVQSGALISGDIEEDEEMPDYVSVGMTDAQDLPPGEWVTVNWGKEYSDSAHHHWNKGGPSFIIGPARYAATCNVRITGLPLGTELQARIIENPESAGDVENGPIAEYVASEGATFVHYNLAADTVRDGYRARFQVIQYGQTTGKITGGSAKGLAWRT